LKERTSNRSSNRILNEPEDDGKEVKKELYVSICGSYSKHLSEMGRRIKECKKLGIEVLIPKYPTRIGATNGFIILKGEQGTPRELQDKNFRAIARSSFLLVVNPLGYIGSSTALEIGYAVARHIPVYCTEEPREYIFTLYTKWGKTLAEIKDSILKSHYSPTRHEIAVRV
jgi:nucleoside 2-deoxyribosyltransferase